MKTFLNYGKCVFVLCKSIAFILFYNVLFKISFVNRLVK